MKGSTIWIIIGIIVVVGVLIWGASTNWWQGSNILSTTPSPSTEIKSGEADVSIENFTFNPNDLKIAKGTKVTWTNNDSTTHNVTSDNGSLKSENIEPGNVFAFTFENTGTFSYNCSIHPQMKATVEVQ